MCYHFLWLFTFLWVTILIFIGFLWACSIQNKDPRKIRGNFPKSDSGAPKLHSNPEPNTGRDFRPELESSLSHRDSSGRSLKNRIESDDSNKGTIHFYLNNSDFFRLREVGDRGNSEATVDNNVSKFRLNAVDPTAGTSVLVLFAFRRNRRNLETQLAETSSITATLWNASQYQEYEEQITNDIPREAEESQWTRNLPRP